MAEIPHEWEAYERLQHKLLSTSCIAISTGLEEALNLVHQADFKPENATEAKLHRARETGARRERHHTQLLRRAKAEALGDITARHHEDEDDVSTGARSLDDAVHAQREISRLAAALSATDWDLLTGVAAGISYDKLALEYGATSSALRSRVCRLRQSIALH